MTQRGVKPGWGKQLLHKVTCPNCWHQFRAEEALFVAKHSDLLGDAVLGDDQFRRFVPFRFTPQGEALDRRGFPTSDLACPRCHLTFPEVMLEVPPLFISMVGSPASGKSYFLTTMSWQLRQLLPKAELSFSDADPVANEAIHEYEQSLFLNSDPDRPTAIRKTAAEDAQLHRRVNIDGVYIRYPVPLQFTLWPTNTGGRVGGGTGRVLVLYDNAGEDFRPSEESAESAAIQHLARSNVLLVLFDLAQDPRFRAACKTDDPQLRQGLRPGQEALSVVDRQETIARQVAVRVRRYLGISQNARLRTPLLVVVPKFDIWQDFVGVEIDEEPYDSNDGKLRVRTDVVDRASEAIRDTVNRFCPEFVATAEALSQTVRYIPVSSLGRSPELVEDGKRSFYGIRPRDIRPKWVTVPLLYALAQWTTGLVDVADNSGDTA